MAFRSRAEEVKRGVWQAGGFPVEMPAFSLSENFQKPTTMIRGCATSAPQRYARGYGRLFMEHINQADQGCDFDFLEGTAPTADPAIY